MFLWDSKRRWTDVGALLHAWKIEKARQIMGTECSLPVDPAMGWRADRKPAVKVGPAIGVSCLAVLALWCGSVRPARAVTITVNSFADTVANDGFCTLPEALAAANNDASFNSMPGECPAGHGADTI